MAIVQKYSDLLKEDREQIVFLALAGATPSTISSHMKVSEPVVHEVITSHVIDKPVEDEEKNFRLDVERLGRLSSQMWAKAANGDQGAAFSAMDIMDRRSALLKKRNEEGEALAPAKSLNGAMKAMMAGVEIPDDPEEDPPGYEGFDSAQYELEEAKEKQEAHRSHRSDHGEDSEYADEEQQEEQ